MVKTSLADHDKPSLAGGIAKGLVEIGVNARADRLQGHPHRFASDRDKAFQAQDVVGLDHSTDLGGKGSGIAHLVTGDDE